MSRAPVVASFSLRARLSACLLACGLAACSSNGPLCEFLGVCEPTPAAAAPSDDGGVVGDKCESAADCPQSYTCVDLVCLPEGPFPRADGGPVADGGSVAVPGSAPTNGLLAYYELDGNLADKVGAGAPDATAGGTLSFGDDRFRRASAALNVRGTPLRVSPLTSLASSYSVSLWFRTESSGAIFATDQVAFTTWGFVELSHQVTGTPLPGVRLQVRDDRGELNPLGVAFAFSPTQWVHVVVVSTNGEWQLYVDGVAAAGTAQGVQTLPSSPWVLGGASFQAPTAYYRGSLDDVRFYSRALTPADVQSLRFERGYQP